MSAKRKSFTAVAKPVLSQSPMVPTKSRIDESRTAVSTGLSPKTFSKRATEATEILSDASSDRAASDNEDEESEDEKESKAPKQRKTSRKLSELKPSQDAADVDTEMASPKLDEPQELGDASDAEPTSPTFGDLIRGNSTVDISTSLAAQASSTVARRKAPQSVAPISSTSLGTVLNQALKTDDRDLLESCLQINDVKIIQNTINRMDSALAGVLLSKLADRMHRRPGRAFGLMKWMQWTMVAHGGTLVTQPGLVSQLGKLSRVLEERSRGLQSLLALKGKLDMLDAQMQLRKSIKSAKSEGSDEESEDVDEPGVVYVEGQENQVKALTNGSVASRGGGADDGDDFPITNGIVEDSDDESEDEDDDVDELADIESMDEDDVDHDDVEDESGEEDADEEDDDEEPAPPAKVQKVSSKFGKKK